MNILNYEKLDKSLWIPSPAKDIKLQDISPVFLNVKVSMVGVKDDCLFY